jgi:SAM-dependent methyltransferase
MFSRRDTERAAPGAPAPRPAGVPAARGPLLPSYPPREYLGQLDPAFQASLSKRREGADLSDFVWYHAFELPDGRVLPGAWDLRGHETAYLGGVDVAGKRVLELGPATGYLTFYMERMGAEVVSFEAGFDVSIDMLPVKGRDDPEGKRRVMQDTIDRNHDAWWHLHRTLGSSAKFVQGSIYDMPADLGTFDITLVGAILLHLREPWGALSQAARRTTGTMIVTEPLQDDLHDPESNIMRFSPSAEHHVTNWWSIYPGAVVSMLSRLGFGLTETTMHSQRHYLAHDMASDAIDQRMYTVVGQRQEG